jgi:hypothetical protein
VLDALGMAITRRYFHKRPKVLWCSCGFPQGEHHTRNHHREIPETGRQDLDKGERVGNTAYTRIPLTMITKQNSEDEFVPCISIMTYAAGRSCIDS